MLNDKNTTDKYEEKLSNMSKNIENIAETIDDDKESSTNYSNQINDIKNNVTTLENELRSFIDEMKLAPLFEKAKEEIKNDTDELAKKYQRNSQIRKKILEMLENKKGLTKEEQNKYNLPTFHLSYVLFAINAILKDDKKALNNAVKQANKLNTKSNLILSIAFMKLNKNNEALKLLDDYFKTINPMSTSENEIAILESLSHYKIFNKKINWYFNQIFANANESVTKEIESKLKKAINNYVVPINSDDFQNIFEYCIEADKIMNNYADSLKYNEIYTDINSYGESTNVDLLEQLVNIKEGKELELENNILKNEAFLLKKPYIENSIVYEETDIFSILIRIVFSRNKDYNLKHFSLHFLKNYLLKILDKKIIIDTNKFNIHINNLKIKIDINNSNDEISNEVLARVGKPFKDEYNKLKTVNAKTIYSASFSAIGFVVMFFNISIGITMFVIGLLMLTYFVLETNAEKNEIHKLCGETVDIYTNELNDTLNELRLVLDTINKNNTKKDDLINLIASS